MTVAMNTNEARRRMQLIIQQVDQLPTLSSIALRLLDATSSDATDAQEVIDLVSADPSLSSKVLQLCRRANKGVNIRDGGIDRAVILLGFDEVRSLAIAVEVFELLDGLSSKGGEAWGDDTSFDRTVFWQHALAVAVLTENLVRQTGYRKKIGIGEAFLAGLLHDLGQLALHTVLPQTFDRICALAETRRVSIDTVCRKMIGVGSHTIGKHLADHWQLPRNLVEVIWLVEQPDASIPDCESRELVKLVTLADALARDRMFAHAGHGPEEHDLDGMVSELGLEMPLVERLIDRLHEEVSDRAASIGLGETTSEELLQQAMDRATQNVKRIAQAQKQSTATLRARSKAITAADRFYRETLPGDSLTTVAEAVLASARIVAGDGPKALVVCVPCRNRAELFLLDDGCRMLPTRTFEPPDELAISFACDQEPRFASVADSLPWVVSQEELPGWIREARVLALESGPDVRAFLICPSTEPDAFFKAHGAILARMWGSSVSASTIQERANALSEQLVEANRRLVETQEFLAEKRAMAALGELAAGAAHEMNNPLTVISGRSQLLARKMTNPELRDAAKEIARQSHRLSDLITSLSLYAQAPVPKPEMVSMIDIANEVVRSMRDRLGSTFSVKLSVEEHLPPTYLDRAQIAAVVRELLQNAHEASPGRQIEFRVQIDPLDDRLMLQVIDAGPGLTRHALEHAFDPFFSEKPAGRQPGLGLARARRLAELNHGEIELKNGPKGGAVAVVRLREWRGRQCPARSAA